MPCRHSRLPPALGGARAGSQVLWTPYRLPLRRRHWVGEGPACEGGKGITHLLGKAGHCPRAREASRDGGQGRGPLWLALYSTSETKFRGAEDSPVRGPDFRPYVLDFVPWAVERPFASAGSLNLDVFRNVKELLSAKNSKREGQIGWAERKKEPSRTKTKEEATALVQAG